MSKVAFACKKNESVSRHLQCFDVFTKLQRFHELLNVHVMWGRIFRKGQNSRLDKAFYLFIRRDYNLRTTVTIDFSVFRRNCIALLFLFVSTRCKTSEYTLYQVFYIYITLPNVTSRKGRRKREKKGERKLYVRWSRYFRIFTITTSPLV